MKSKNFKIIFTSLVCSSILSCININAMNSKTKISSKIQTIQSNSKINKNLNTTNMNINARTTKNKLDIKEYHIKNNKPFGPKTQNIQLHKKYQLKNRSDEPEMNIYNDSYNFDNIFEDTLKKANNLELENEKLEKELLKYDKNNEIMEEEKNRLEKKAIAKIKK